MPDATCILPQQVWLELRKTLTSCSCTWSDRVGLIRLRWVPQQGAVIPAPPPPSWITLICTPSLIRGQVLQALQHNWNNQHQNQFHITKLLSTEPVENPNSWWAVATEGTSHLPCFLYHICLNVFTLIDLQRQWGLLWLQHGTLQAQTDKSQPKKLQESYTT